MIGLFMMKRKKSVLVKNAVVHGTLIADSPYLNKDVSDYPFGSGGAIRYIP